MSDRNSKPGVTTLFWLNVASGPVDEQPDLQAGQAAEGRSQKHRVHKKHSEAPSKFEKQTPLLAEHNLGSTPSTSGG